MPRPFAAIPTPAAKVEGSTPSGFNAFTGDSMEAQVAQNNADYEAATGHPTEAARAERREHRLDQDIRRDEQRAGAKGGVAANPFAGAPSVPGGHGSPGAPAPSNMAMGYEAMGDNPNDPRQVAAQAALGHVSGDTQALVQRQADQAYQSAATMQAAIAGQANQQRLDAIDEQKKRDEAKAYAEGSRQKAAQLEDDVANSRVDPDAIYRGSAGGVRHVMAGIGSALGAIGAVYGHTQNFAQQIIDKQVEQSIDAQKANMANKQKAADNAKGAYQMLREQGLDDASARAATRSLAYGAAAKDTEALAAGISNDDRRRQAEALAQQLRQSQAEAAAQHTTAANAKGFEIAEERRREALRASAKIAAAGAAAAKVEQGAAPGTLAADEIVDQDGDVAGFGLGGRILHTVAGGALDSEDARANYRNREALAAATLKAEGARPSPELIDRYEHNVRSEGDVVRSAKEYKAMVARQMRAAEKQKGGGGGGHARDEEDE